MCTDKAAGCRGSCHDRGRVPAAPSYEYLHNGFVLTLGVIAGNLQRTNKAALKDCGHRAKCIILSHRFRSRRPPHVPPLHTCRGAGLSARAPNQRPVRGRVANQRRHAQVPPRGRRAARTLSWLSGGEQGGRILLRSSLALPHSLGKQDVRRLPGARHVFTL